MIFLSSTKSQENLTAVNTYFELITWQAPFSELEIIPVYPHGSMLKVMAIKDCSQTWVAVTALLEPTTAKGRAIGLSSLGSRGTLLPESQREAPGKS